MSLVRTQQMKAALKQIVWSSVSQPGQDRTHFKTSCNSLRLRPSLWPVTCHDSFLLLHWTVPMVLSSLKPGAEFRYLQQIIALTVRNNVELLVRASLMWWWSSASYIIGTG